MLVRLAVKPEKRRRTACATMYINSLGRVLDPKTAKYYGTYCPETDDFVADSTFSRERSIVFAKPNPPCSEIVCAN